jgi:mRNA-degrading endonuclease RelE of RelBE toxin-antitoxin system
MWRIKEHRDVAKQCLKLPLTIVKKCELWKNIVFRHGPEKLKEFSGFHDEKLKGERKGQRSSRLSSQYSVIYTVKRDIVTVLVMEITLHKY